MFAKPQLIHGNKQVTGLHAMAAYKYLRFHFDCNKARKKRPAKFFMAKIAAAA
jgi:hypothetical protein